MKKKKASAGTLAGKDKLQHISYRGDVTMSSSNLKEQIGELLFCLEFPVGKEFHQIGWIIFEGLLRTYIELKYVC